MDNVFILIDFDGFVKCPEANTSLFVPKPCHPLRNDGQGRALTVSRLLKIRYRRGRLSRGVFAKLSFEVLNFYFKTQA